MMSKPWHPPCPECGQPLAVSNKKRLTLRCPNGCWWAQPSLKPAIEHAREAYAKEAPEGKATAAGAPADKKAAKAPHTAPGAASDPAAPTAPTAPAPSSSGAGEPAKPRGWLW